MEPEADAEEIISLSDPQFCIIEKMHKEKELLWEARVRKFQDWYQPIYQKNKWTWQTGAQDAQGGSSSGWRGSSRRGASAPPPDQIIDRDGPAAEPPKEWCTLEQPNLDPAFLFPETSTEKCPIDKTTAQHTNEESDL